MEITTVPTGIPASGGTSLPPDPALAERQLAFALWRAQGAQPETAAPIFEDALRLNPSDASYAMCYARYLADQQQWKAAKQLLSRALTISTDNASKWLDHEQIQSPDSIALMYLRALHSVLTERHDRRTETQAIFEKLLELYPEQGDILIELSAFLETTGAWGAAEQIYHRVLQIDPPRAEWFTAYGAFLEKRGRCRDALSKYERALSLNPNYPNLREHIAPLAEKIKHEQEAHGYAALAKLMLEQDEMEEASSLVGKALEFSPDLALAHSVQAEILKRKGLLTEAEIHLRRAIEIEPGNTEYQDALQNLRAGAQARRLEVERLVVRAHTTPDQAMAAQLLDQALALMPDSALAHLAYAELLKENAPAETERHLRQVLATESQNLEAHRQLARLLDQQGRRAEAGRHLLAILEQEPQNETAIIEYVDWLINQGQYQNAARQVQSAAERMSLGKRMQVQQAIAWAGQPERRDDALRQFETLAQTFPDDAIIHREYGIALREKHCYELAEKALHRAIELDPADAVTHLGIAVLLRQSQRFPEAHAWIQKALALTPHDERIRAEAASISEQLRQFEPAEQELAYARYSIQQNKVGIARQSFEQGLKLKGDSVLVLREYAIFLKQQGDLFRAQGDWLRADQDLRRARGLVDQALSILPLEPQLGSLLAEIERDLAQTSVEISKQQEIQRQPQQQQQEPVSTTQPESKRQSLLDKFIGLFGTNSRSRRA